MKRLHEALASREKKATKLSVASSIFGCSKERMESVLLSRATSILPNKPIPLGVPDLDIESCERVDDNLCRIELKSGRVFFGHRSEQKHYIWHHLFRDIVPEQISGDAYKLALDIQTRYFGSKSAPWYFPKGGIYVEGGCYTGIKAMRWHDLLGGDCKIIAVEIGRSNFDIMQMNLAANNMNGTIIPVNVGLWREDGWMVQKHNFTTRRFLERTDRWEPHFLNEEEVRVVSIPTLLDEHEIDVVDYFNIQVNGGEIEVLKGLKDFNRVKIFGVAAYYSKDGIRNVDVVREIALKNGCRIIGESTAGRIEFITPNYIDEVLSRQPGQRK